MSMSICNRSVGSGSLIETMPELGFEESGGSVGGSTISRISRRSARSASGIGVSSKVTGARPELRRSAAFSSGLTSFFWGLALLSTSSSSEGFRSVRPAGKASRRGVLSLGIGSGVCTSRAKSLVAPPAEVSSLCGPSPGFRPGTFISALNEERAILRQSDTRAQARINVRLAFPRSGS